MAAEVLGEYGRLLSAPTLELGLERTVRTWVGAYLGEVLEQHYAAAVAITGEPMPEDVRYVLPDPTDVVRQSEFTWPVEGQLALVVIATPGTTGDAVHGPDDIDATWEAQVGVVADLGDYGPTREAMQFYAAACGACLEHKGIDVPGAGVRWAGENYGILAERDARTLMGGAARILVTVEGARSSFGGPDAPPPIDDRPPGVPRPHDPPITVVPTIAKEPLA